MWLPFFFRVIPTYSILPYANILAVRTSTKSGLQDQLYQRSHVKSVPKKCIKSGIFSLSHTKKVANSDANLKMPAQTVEVWP